MNEENKIMNEENNIMNNTEKPENDLEDIIKGEELEELIGEIEVLHEKLRALGLAIEDLNPRLKPIMKKGVPEEEHGNYQPFLNARRSPKSRIAKKIHYLIQVSTWAKNDIDYILKYADINYNYSTKPQLANPTNEVDNVQVENTYMIYKDLYIFKGLPLNDNVNKDLFALDDFVFVLGKDKKEVENALKDGKICDKETNFFKYFNAMFEVMGIEEWGGRLLKNFKIKHNIK